MPSAHRATKQLMLGRTDFKQYTSCNNGIRLQEFNIAIGFVVLRVKGCV
jgi:hypothetical protein